jgi:hypothetical protein
VDPETLAAFREELLPRRKAERVAKHLARCTQCAGLDAQLADLPALLADVPAPPMPDALTARIAAALAEEAAARSAGVPAGAAAAQAAADGDAAAAQPGDAANGARGRGTRRAARAPGPGRSRLALRIATVAAVVVVIVGGGFGVSRLFSGTSAHTAASGSAPVPATHTAPRIALQAPNQSGGTKSGNKDHSAASGSTGYHVAASGTNYEPGRLGAQVKSVLSQPGRLPASPVKGTSSTLRMAGLTSCLAHVVGTQQPRLVDLAHYDRRPAIVIVLPAGPNTLRVLVVGPRCSATTTDLLASTTLHGVR